ncbi:hypothetical protein OSTOST_04872, partial [Ostertagia ostertagi]
LHCAGTFQLVTGYGTDPKITRSVEKFDWYIVPEANPDGIRVQPAIGKSLYVYDRLWRKTRSRNTTVNKWCVGADANRNWGHRWGEAGANRSPCSNIYAGSRPFSEPEIVGKPQRSRDMADSEPRDLRQPPLLRAATIVSVGLHTSTLHAARPEQLMTEVKKCSPL